MGRRAPALEQEGGRGRAARPWRRAIVTTVAAAAALHACGGSNPDPTPEAAGPTSTASAPAATSTPVDDRAPTADDFVNLADMTPVRGFLVDNLAGDLDATLAVARSADGGTYPVGSVVQLVPTEAMVKRAPGFSPATNDWEFFVLDATDQGTAIVTRGGAEVVNRFGGSCADCHSAAEARFDLVCEQDHGCAPLPIGRPIIEALQDTDPRPRTDG